MDVTPEMRKAVYEADCAEHGHILDTRQAISNSPLNNPDINAPVVRSDNPFKMPHILCQRCRMVWLVMEEGKESYESALENLNSQLLAKYKRAVPPAESASIEEVHDPAQGVS